MHTNTQIQIYTCVPACTILIRIISYVINSVYYILPLCFASSMKATYNNNNNNINLNLIECPNSIVTQRRRASRLKIIHPDKTLSHTEKKTHNMIKM